MAITLGRAPDPLTVVLPRGGAFVIALEAPTDWVDGTSIQLQFQVTENATPIVWPATVVGQLASWEIGPDDVADVLDTKALLASLIYSVPGSEPIVWARGKTNAY